MINKCINFKTSYLISILFRCIDVPDTAAVCIYGYQVKIDPNPRKWTFLLWQQID